MLFPKDAKVSVGKTADAIEIKWNWYRKDRGAFVANALMLLAISIGGLLAPDNPRNPNPPFANSMFWFFLLTVVPGLSLFAATWFVNRSIIRADRNVLRVSSAPFPWIRPFEIPGPGIKQFFVTQAGTNGKKWTLGCLDASSNYRYLGEYFSSEIAAHQVCHELQDFYGLKDLPIYGQNTLPHQPGSRSQ